MLQVNLKYNWDNGIFPILSKYGFQFKGSYYTKKLKSDAFIIQAIHDNQNNIITLSCENEVSFDGCKELHATIKHLAENLAATIDDTDAMLGYDRDGNPAYLFHGFNNWSMFLDQAKHRSMEGFTVEVFDGKNLLGRGILIESALTKQNAEKQTPSCTIISSDGEESFFGDNLSIVPVTEETGFGI